MLKVECGPMPNVMAALPGIGLNLALRPVFSVTAEISRGKSIELDVCHIFTHGVALVRI